MIQRCRWNLLDGIVIEDKQRSAFLIDQRVSDPNDQFLEFFSSGLSRNKLPSQFYERKVLYHRRSICIMESGNT